MDNFYAEAHAKCLLAGEHAVLIGVPGIAMPLLSCRAILTCNNKNGAIPLTDPLIKFFTRGAALLGKRPDEVERHFYLESQIPIGSGLGFSAVLSVLVARWFIWKKWLPQEALFDFSHSLEEEVHGRSSGIDIAGVLAEKIVHFQLTPRPTIREIHCLWKPHFALSFSGTKKSTKKMVESVIRGRKENPQERDKIDRLMQKSVELIEAGLTTDETSGFPLLVEGMELANGCFESWGLISAEMQVHREELRRMGAFAVKPTGAGGGGYLLSLWKEPPKEKEGYLWC